jgi:hypothetical protein
LVEQLRENHFTSLGHNIFLKSRRIEKGFSCFFTSKSFAKKLYLEGRTLKSVLQRMFLP